MSAFNNTIVSHQKNNTSKEWSSRSRVRFLTGASAFAILAAAGATESAHATAISWNINADGNFNTAGDWSTNTVPASADDITIDRGATAVTVTSTTTNAVNSVVTGTNAMLAIGAGTTFTINNGSGAGANAGTISLGNAGSLLLGGTQNNTGTIVVNSAGNLTDLRFADGTKLIGGGTVALSNNANNRIYGASNSGTETVTNVDNRIQGAGQFGLSNSIEFINQSKGVINANGANALVVTPTIVGAPVTANGGGFVNQGLLEATNTGGLMLSGGQFNNAGGTIMAVGTGHVDLMNNVVISGGTVTSNGGGVVETVAGHTASLDGASQGTLTFGGTYQITNASTTFISGTLNNTGTINLNSAGNLTDLRFADGTKLTGGGIIAMSDEASLNNRIYGASNSGTETATNVDNTIHGAGQLGVSNSFEFINKATINADATNALIITPTVVNGTGIVTANGGGFVNQGLLEATNSGGLTLSGGQFNNKLGTIKAVGTGHVDLVNNVVISGGTVTSSGGGVVKMVAGHSATLDGASQGTLTLGGTYQITNASTTFISGTLDNTGTINVNSVGNLTDLHFADGAQITGGGVIAMSNDANNRIYGSANTGTETVTNVDNLIHGAGSLGASNSFEFINKATINADATNALVITPTVVNSSGIVTANGGGFVNQGLLEATNIGGLFLNSGQFNNKTGTIKAVGAGNNVYLQNNVVISGGTVTSGGGGMVETVGGHFASLDGASQGALTNSGTLQITNNSTVFVNGTINNTGAINLNSLGNLTDLHFADGAQITGGGTITLSDVSGTNRIYGSANSGTETVTNVDNLIHGAGQIGAGNSVEFINKATINADATNALVITPTIVAAPVATNKGGFVNQGLLEATNTGGLFLNSGQFNNKAGTIKAVGVGNNVYLQNNVVISGGILTSSSGGMVETVGGHTVSLDGTSLGALTNSGSFQITNNSTLFVNGTINNTGTITLNSAGNLTDLHIADGTQLTGGGTVSLSDTASTNRIWGTTNSGTEVLTNVDNTIQGAGQIGVSNDFKLVNGGTINATGANALIIAPTTNGTVGTQLVNQVGGMLEGSGAGGLSITQGTVDNQGTVQALDGSSVTYQPAATTLNNVAGTLTGGSWNAISTGKGATVSINGAPVTTDAANITLSGAGSVFQVRNGGGNTFTPLETSLTTIASTGQLHVLNNRSYATANDIGNSGLLDVGGGTFASKSMTNTSTGTISGFGTVAPVVGQVANAGLVVAHGGTLTVTPGIAGSAGSTIRIDAGAGLDLGAATAASSTDTLTHNGSNLNLGAQNILVSADYTNANFGVGNAFNNHANVTGIGKILATGDVGMSVTGAGITGGTSATPTLALGNVHVSGATKATFNINNTGSTGPVLRGAVQNTGISATGLGVTAQNYGPIALGGSTPETVSFAPTSAGALSGQTFKVVTNFDNVAAKTVTVTGAAYDLANPTINNSQPVTFGNHHVGDVITKQAVSVTNKVITNASFQEGLNASVGGTSGGVTTNNGSFNLLGAGGTNNAAIAVGIDTATAGSKNGAATLKFVSDGTGTSGLGTTNLASQNVNVTGAVYNLAQANTIQALTFGNVHQGSSASQALSVSNIAPGGSFTEKLDAQFGGTTDARILTNGSISLLGAGSTDNSSMVVSIDTTNTGTINGSAHVLLQSDGQGTSGLGKTSLAAQDVGVTATIQTSGNVFGLAQASQHTPEPVNFGNVRIGSAQSQALTLSNTAADDSFHEKLDGQIGGATGAAMTNGGSFSLLGPQATDSTSLVVGLNTSVGGAQSGQATITLQSDGKGTSGLGITNLPSQTVNVSGNVYRLANPTLNTGSVTLAARVGDAAASAGVSVTNSSPDVFTEGLKASIGGASGPFTTGGAIANLAAQGTDGSSLKVGLGTGTSGTFNGSAAVSYTSTGAGTDSASDLSVGSGSVALTGKVYQTATASVSGGPLDFGIVHVGDSVATKAVTVANTASGALVDVVTGVFGAVTGPFTGSGTLGSGVAAGSSDGSSLKVGLNTASAGVFSGTANLALASHDGDLKDVALTSAPVTAQGQVNNFAKGAFLQTGGAGVLSGTGASYLLDFGTLTQSAGQVLADLAVKNDVVGPADDLSGSFVLPSLPSDLSLTGFGSFLNLGAGSKDTGLTVGLDASFASFFDVFVTLNELGSNASGFQGALPSITLELRGNVVAAGANVPEPGTFALFGSGLAGLAFATRRRRDKTIGR